FALGIAGDNLNEAGETFSITFSIAAGDQSAATANGDVELPGEHRVTISDDDAIALTATPADAGVTEGGNAVLNIDLGAIPSRDITFSYTVGMTSATDDVDATVSGAGADLTDSSGGTITITAAGGVSTGAITLAITDDELNEAAEAFSVNIAASSITNQHGSASVVSGSQATVFTIAASDPLTASIARASGQAATVDEGSSARFTVTLSGATGGSAAAVTVPYSVSVAGAGYALADLGGAAGSLSIDAGRSEGTITINLPFSNPLGSAAAAQTVSITLAGDDATTPETDEGPTAGAGGGVVMRSSTLGEQSAGVEVNFLDAQHSFAFTSPATNISEGAAATYTVTRNGPALSGAAGITVTWGYAAGTPAPVGSDFEGDTVPAGGTLEFTATEAMETFTVTTREDTLNEADERFTLTLSIAGGAHASAAEAEGGATLPAALTVTIADDDPVSVALTRASGSGAVSEDSGAFSFTVTVSGGTRASGVSVVVPFTVSGLDEAEFDITAPLIDDDNDPSTDPVAPAATATGGTVTIAPGSSSGVISVTLLDDDVNEATETVTVTGTAAGDSGLRLSGSGFGAVEYTTGGATASVAVTDTDAITLTIAHAGSDADGDTAGFQVTEGSDATFTVTLGGAGGGSSTEVTVAYSVSGEVEAADYTDAGGGTLTIPAGTASGMIRIAIADDADADLSEDLTVTIAETGHSAAGVIMRSTTTEEQSATASIIPRPAAHRLTLTNPAASIAETDEDAAT
ncbi:MAG: hypothetical protein OXU61_12565, partial [Gammaproteobacteria bacterium]|nr:hypothetical protein [Gammaproteobacteria bacterium]